MQFVSYKQSVMNSEASMMTGQSLLVTHFIYNKFPFKTHAHSHTICPMQMGNPKISTMQTIHTTYAKPKQCRNTGAVKPAQLLEILFSEKILNGKCNLKHTKSTKEDLHDQILCPTC